MIQHKGTISIETIRLLLRRFEPEDAEDMYYNWASDPEVCRFLAWGPHEELKVTQRRVKDWADYYKRNNNYYNWAICFKDNNRPIGSISAEILNDINLSCEVGYCLGRAYWGRGIMTEALLAVIHYLFFDVGYQRVTAKHDVLNVASGRVMQKTGMRFDKILPNASRRRDGTPCDVAVYVKDIADD